MNKITYKQKVFLDFTVEGEWSINPYTKVIDAISDVCIYIKTETTEIPIEFGKVSGDFDCMYC
jgi:hypothetical protein